MTYALLKPVKVPKPGKAEVTIYSYIMSPSRIRYALAQIPEGELVAVDIETQGVQAADPACRVVGIGVAWARGTYYFDLETNSIEANAALADFLTRKDIQFIGHNVFFDSAFLTRELGTWMNWCWDTYGMFRQLASEGWIGQKYGLKDAQVDLLGWDKRGDEELSLWLVKAGWVKNKETVGTWDVERRVKGYEEGRVRPDKGEMWRAPGTVLGYYCGLDAYSTLQLFDKVLAGVLDNFPAAWTDVFVHYHETFIINTRLLVEQQLRGIEIDSQILADFDVKLDESIADLTRQFAAHPTIAPILAEYNAARLADLKSLEPAQYKKLPVLGAEPAKLTKKGTPSKAWEQWDIKRQAIAALGQGEISLNWKNWEARFLTLETAIAASPVGLYNVSSGPQRQWLFYEKLGHEIRVLTKSEQPATDKKALPGFGEPGKLLNRLDKQVKLTTFIESLRGKILGSTLHPQFNVPGTFTGRLGGSGKFNLQNIPKSFSFASAFKARPGHVWVDLDFASLEQVVMAELSRDPTLLKLYGPEARDNDVYLFNGAQLPIIGAKIRAAGYDPDNPTTEGIASAKKLAKRERHIAKTITLASSYGAGAGKIRATLELEDVRITYEEAEALKNGYWELYSGVKKYQKYLEDEWERRQGWVFNGVGRPVCCFEDKKKDLVNRVVQSTGHDILMFFIRQLFEIREQRKIPMWPVFLDTHDATTWECPEAAGPLVKAAFEESLALTNDWLMGENGLIRLKGDAAIVSNLAEAKGLVE